MRRFGRFLLWAVVFIFLLLTVDLSMIYVPSRSDVFNRLRGVYLDLRARMLGLVTDGATVLPESFSRRIRSERAERDVPRSSAGESGPHFFYVDKRGDIHFVATLDEIPRVYRSRAQRLER